MNRIALVSIVFEERWKMQLFADRKWIPVYWPPHTDPDLGTAGALSHCHIAWNRVSPRYRFSTAAAAPVWEYQIETVKHPKVTPPIISAPCAPNWRKEFPEMEAL